MPGVPHDDDLPEDDPLDPAVLGERADATEDLLEELLHAERWPDEPVDDDPLPEAPTPRAPAVHALVDDRGDDDGVELETPITEEAPLPSLDDEPTVLPWRAEMLVDGVPTVTIADPTTPGSTLFRHHPTADRQTVTLRFRGVRFDLSVRVEAGEDRLRLGRDALRRRFVISADND